ncbi:hypothetical protein [Pollutibacter soli]|uniref:hypothetical protein n=1 Tax=Pollutibacter soli TaxID=3034157 RepID=UPI0030136ACA
MNIVLDEFVVMPDHFHGIIGFNNFNRCFNPMDVMRIDRRDAMHGVPTINTNKYGPQSKNLAPIIRGFKSSVTTAARKLGLPFDWQTRFHEHAIRDEMELKRIVQ